MKRVSLVLLLACAFMAIAVGSAFAEEPLYTENAQCFECHGANLGGPATKKVDFGVGAVDKSTACAKCHWVPGHIDHYATRVCTACHVGWPERGPIWVSSVQSPDGYGYFATPTSRSADATALHAIHNNGSWPGSLTPKYGVCGNCHAPAACSACHEGVTHGTHSGTQFTPVENRVAVGTEPGLLDARGLKTAEGVIGPDLTSTAGEYCINQACHSVAGRSDRFTRLDQTAGEVTATGAWSTLSNPADSGGSVILSNVVGSTVTLHFQGSSVRWIGRKTTLGGWAEVSIDGSIVTTVNTQVQWGAPLTTQNLYTVTNLPGGSHVLQLKILANPSPLRAKYTEVSVDAFDVNFDRAAESYNVFCGSCHADQTSAHGYDTVDHVADDGDLSGAACTACHSLDLSAEHEKATSSSATLDCGACHPSPRDSFEAWDQSCVTGGCHTETSTAPMHGGAATAHDVVPEGEICLTCHAGTDLETIHATALIEETGAASCFVCHGGEAAPVTNNCTDSRCHFTFENHYDGVVHTSTWTLDNCSAAGCHSTRDLMGAHLEKDSEFTCMGCHDSERQAVVDAIEDGVTGCSACHTGMTETSGHYDIHMANPPLKDADGPNYGYWLGSESTEPTGDCAGCHTHNLVDEHLGMPSAVPGVWTIEPRKDSNGNLLSCATCHNSLDGGVMTAITLGQTKCDACHVVHGPIGWVHESQFTETQEVDCAACHNKYLQMEHNGTYYTTTPSGTKLVGCDVCHDYYEAPLGPIVQDAISASNTTMCAGCHEVEHPDFGSHDAVAAESLACAECHGTGSPTSVDIKAVHAEADAGPCAVCHMNPARVPDISAKTGECASCHAAAGVDYHRGLPGAHTFDAMDSSCSSIDCHGANTLPEVHEEYLATQAEFDTTCALCHDNPERIPDIKSKTADCSSCHEVHGDIEVIHQAPDSSACVACHETADVRQIHACATCHNATVDTSGTTKCASAACHGSAYPVKDPDHYSTTKHAAAEIGCSDCHSMDMKTEHYKSTVNVTCVQCHEVKVDHFTAPWDKTCAACHPTKHGDKTAKHTALASPDCARCHDKDIAAGMNVEPVHAKAPQGECAVCHVSSIRVPDVTTKTAECASCHAISTIDYHRSMNGAHAFTGMSASCIAAGCHVSKSLPDEHARFLGRYPSYTDSCALCHLNTDADRIDWKTATADCSSCHTVHGDIEVIHQAPDSSACIDCHETADVREIHACATCHNATVDTSGTTACASTACHGDEYPSPDPYHYDSTKHLASDAGCGQCHFADMKAEHFKPNVAVTCVQCHETKVDYFTTPWDKTCAACHPTKHGEKNAKHKSTNTACSGVGCHDITDASKIHMTLTDNGGGKGCWACHKSASESATTTNCTTAGCHSDVGTDHHAAHDTSGVVDAGCSGCHFRYLDDEHSKLGYACSTCHASTNAAVKNAITAGRRDCDACHPAVNGKDRHANQKTNEFIPENSGGHRVDSSLPWMKSSFLVNGATYTMPLPSASAFLKTGWTTTSVVTCDQCHNFGTDPAGPHGASVTVRIDPAYPTSWKTVYLNSNGASSTTFICAKCHTNFRTMNGVHNEGDHQDSSDGKCVNCHSQIPHAWRLPRLLAYTTDPAPYATASGGLEQLKLRSHSSASDWQESDCYAACAGDHGSRLTPVWPSATNTVGTLAGTVRTTAGTAISGATVTVGTLSASTASNGTYTIVGVPTGSQTVTVTKSGYVKQTATVAIYRNQTTTCDFALEAGASYENLAPLGTATASDFRSGYEPVKAIDGSLSTRWSSSGKDTRWLAVDLGQTRGLDKVVVAWSGDYYARAYKVQVSTDNTSWTDVYSTTSGTSGTKTHTFTARNARYVRLYCTSANRDYYSVNEFEIWGSDALAGTVTGRVTDSANGKGLAGVAVAVAGDGSTTTDSSGYYTLSAVPVGTQSITYSASGYTSQTMNVNVVNGATTTLNVALSPVPPAVNLALNKVFAASRYENNTYAPGKAGDGSTSSYWWSDDIGGKEATEWLRVDLGTKYRIKTVEVAWFGDYWAKEFRIYTSTDNRSWTEVYATTSGTSGTSVVTFTARDARYVKLECRRTGTGNDNGYGVAEMRVFQ